MSKLDYFLNKNILNHRMYFFLTYIEDVLKNFVLKITD